MRSRFTIGFILAITCLTVAWARTDPALKAKIEAFYDKSDQLLGAKDVEGWMSLLTEDFQFIFAGNAKDGIRSGLKEKFKGSDELLDSHRILEIAPSGNMIKVIYDTKIEKRSGKEDWKMVSQGTGLDYLIYENGSLKIARSAVIDKYRLTNVMGQSYRDMRAGISFSVPSKWEIIPTEHSTLQGAVYVLAPELSSAVMFGYMPSGGAMAQKAAEGDEAIGKLLSKPEAYKLIKSGPIRFAGRSGYEIESEFFIPNDRERHRRRVYLDAGPFLHVFCFDAMPPKQWDKVKDGFQSIIDSIK
jgi:hypothetical protein